jgi:hypothetical protein
MFFSNDVPSILQRCRVFNLYIVPKLKNDKNILGGISVNQNHILFTYDFRTDKFTYDGLYSLEDVREKYLKVDDTGKSHYKNLASQLNPVENDGDSYFYISIFHFGAKGYFHPSLYKHPLEDVSLWNEENILIMGDSPEHSEYNQWFSNNILKSHLDWEKMKGLKDVFDNIPDGEILLYTVNNNRDEVDMYYYKFEDYIKNCDAALVPLDMMQLFKDEYAKGNNILVMNMINYLHDYFLLVRLNKLEDGNYVFNFISSPRDTSLTVSL